MARPVIAITGPQRGAFGPRMLVALAIRWYGGRALQLRPGDENQSHKYDGVVVTGGHDIEPVLYAAEPEIEPNYDTARDALETAVIADAVRRELPLLGICRGAQLLNVCRGGSLYQELTAAQNIQPMDCVTAQDIVCRRCAGNARQSANHSLRARSLTHQQSAQSGH